MRPVKLTIKNFISYKGAPAVIDFDDYRCLFLISGNTGAGKTTIFDAMTYALYGEVSADETNSDKTRAKNGRSDCVRCESAPEGQETSVEFVFEHQGKTYTIKRGISGRRDRKDGLVHYDSKFQSLTGNGLSLDKTGEISTKIKDLFGLDAHQWRNVVMLAQSQFMSFLKASTEDRTKILNNLFDTSRYERVETKLSDMANDAAKTSDGKYSALASVPGRFQFGDDTESKNRCLALSNADVFSEAEEIERMFESSLESDKMALSSAEESLDGLEKERNAARSAAEEAERLTRQYSDLRSKEKALADLAARDEEIEGKRSDLKMARTAITEVNPKYQGYEKSKNDLATKIKDLDQTKERIAAAESELTAAQKACNEAQEEDRDEQPLRDEASKIYPLLKKFDELEGVEKQKSVLTEQKTRTEKDLTGRKNFLTELQEKILTEQKFIDDNPDVSAEIVKCQNDKRSYEESLQNLQVIKTCMTHMEYDRKQKEKAETEFEDAKAASETAESRYGELIKKRDEHIAGSLASGLKDGCMCPVCGSLQHPRPAPLSPNAPTDADLKKAEKKKTETRENEETYRRKFDEMDRNLQASTAQFKVRMEKFPEPVQEDEDVLAAIDRLTMKIKKESIANNDHLSMLNDMATKIESSRTGLKTMREEEVRLRQEIEMLGESLHESEKKLSEVNATAIGLAKELTAFRSRRDAEKMIGDLTDKADRLRKTLDEAKGRLSNADKALAGLKGRADELEKDIENLKVTVATSEKLYLETLEKCHFPDTGTFLRYMEVSKYADSLEKEIDEHESSKTALNAAVVTIKDGIAGRPEPEDLGSYEERRKNADERYDRANSLKVSLRVRIQTNGAVLGDFRNAYVEAGKARGRAIMLNDLLDTYKGKGSGAKVSFNQFVLGGYLDAIVANATRRLKEMSSNRYELRRIEKATSRQGSNALDLDIYDNHTGHTRSINTLSGGEAFMTALSLSLSISDTIQSTAKGKVVEGLFIDEGFGTLDDSTRNLAVNTLKEMSDEKISIGIISHVEDLRNMIEKGMEVTYSPAEGSRIRFY